MFLSRALLLTSMVTCVTLFYSTAKLREGHEDLLRMLKTAAEG
jgi:hypothetical protein